MLKDLVSRIRAYLPSSNRAPYFSRLLDSFKSSVDGIVGVSIAQDIDKVDPGAFNIQLENLMQQFISATGDRTQRYYERTHPIAINPKTRAVYQQDEARFRAERDNALQESYKHLALRLSRMGEGYSLLKRIGVEDPLSELSITPLTYITGKVQKIHELLQKGITHGHALGYHFTEIIHVGNQYGINLAELVGVRIVAIKYALVSNGQRFTDTEIKGFIKELQQQAVRGEPQLDPWNQIIFRMPEVKGF